MNTSKSLNLRQILIDVYMEGWHASAPDVWDNKMLDAAQSAIVEAVEGLIDRMPERGFSIPKEGTPSFEQGAFTKLISSEEVLQAIKEWQDGDTA